MNNEQARFILGAYRPGGSDAGDPTFEEALRQARTDPALGVWLTREQAFDGAVAAKLRAIAPPAELREAILTGARVSGARPRPRWGFPAWLALAASVAIILGLTGTFWFQNSASESVVFDRLAGFALAEPLSAHTGPHADQLGAFGAWLRDPAHRLATLPGVDLGLLKADGCRTVNIAGHQVFEICIQRSSGMYHLYIGRRGDFGLRFGETAPVFFRQGPRSAAAWVNRQFVYVLMTVGGTAALRQAL